MAKPPKGARAGLAPATDADHEQQSGEPPQEPTRNATDTPNPMPMQALGKIPTPELAKAMNQILTTTQQAKRQAMQPELAPRR